MRRMEYYSNMPEYQYPLVSFRRYDYIMMFFFKLKFYIRRVTMKPEAIPFFITLFSIHSSR